MTRTFLQWILLAYLTGVIANDSQTRQLRVVHKLVGGHISLSRNDDAGLLTSSAGDGKESKKKTSESKEEKKTLAQQVADGKYALIQTELFSRPIKKPGLLSYRENGEVPRDTITNLGGLNKSDIWLSENHLLVIKGGSFPPHSSQNLETEVWPSLDDYHAPNRQVKIPAHPKVPPPFPVQLTDGGPLLLLGTNATKTINGTFPPPVYPVFPEENYVPGGEPPPGNFYRFYCRFWVDLFRFEECFFLVFLYFLQSRDEDFHDVLRKMKIWALEFFTTSSSTSSNLGIPLGFS